jgi:hypothetical protein
LAINRQVDRFVLSQHALALMRAAQARLNS